MAGGARLRLLASPGAGRVRGAQAPALGAHPPPRSLPGSEPRRPPWAPLPPVSPLSGSFSFPQGLMLSPPDPVWGGNPIPFSRGSGRGGEGGGG